jgi:hypothetical protein
LRSDYYPVKVGWDFTTRSRKAKVVAGAIEAESLKVQFKSKGRVEPQDMAPYGSHWSGDSQMVWWGGLDKNDRLVLEVPLEKAGVYALALQRLGCRGLPKSSGKGWAEGLVARVSKQAVSRASGSAVRLARVWTTLRMISEQDESH